MNNWLKILLINTESAQLRAYATFLHSHGCNVLIANDLIQGEQISKKKSPDILVIFIQQYQDIPASLLVRKFLGFEGKLIINEIGTQDFTTVSDDANFCLISGPEIVGKEYLLKLCTDREKKIVETGTKNVPAVKEKKKHKVLLVEDNPLNNLYYCEILDNLPVTYASCENMDSALRAAAENEFDLLITDFMLTDGNGIELLKHINSFRKIPSVLISGSTKEDLMRTYGTLECTEFIEKPIGEQELIRVISDLLGIAPMENETTNSRPKEYNFTEMKRLLKGDRQKMELCLSEFTAIVKKAIHLIGSVTAGQFEQVSSVFHDLLNFCGYFGLSRLRYLILEFRNSEDPQQKKGILSGICTELVSVDSFYSMHLQELHHI